MNDIDIRIINNVKRTSIRPQFNIKVIAILKKPTYVTYYAVLTDQPFFYLSFIEPIINISFFEEWRVLTPEDWANIVHKEHIRWVKE